ncbi:MAG: YdcF family protein [Ktedonobacteraceae bacterium]|nr:YdcF family protein [Ktedonobacteraceae bacterium]
MIKELLLALLMISIGILVLLPLFTWLILFRYGKQFALRDTLHPADAIVVLAGTRGNIRFLDGKIRTAVHLYKERRAPYIICSGKFSVKVTETPTLISMEELRSAVAAGRIQEKDVAAAAKNWDIGLGAGYMRDQILQMGVEPQVVLIEQESLHTRENAEYVLTVLKKHGIHRVILVTSPFHQLRTFLTFAKVLRPHGITILNYYAETGEWHPATWFLSAEHRRLVKSEMARIKLYRAKGDLL